MVLPLLTRAIYDNVSAARAEGRTGRPAPATIGMAIGTFAVMIFGEICFVHARRLSNVMGHTLRGTVRDSTARTAPSEADVAQLIDMMSRKSMYVPQVTQGPTDAQALDH